MVGRRLRFQCRAQLWCMCLAIRAVAAGDDNKMLSCGETLHECGDVIWWGGVVVAGAGGGMMTVAKQTAVVRIVLSNTTPTARTHACTHHKYKHTHA